MKDKKAKIVLNSFIGMTNEFKREPKNLLTDQEREKWLDNKKKIVRWYSAHNEGKSVVAERFIRTLKGFFYKK